MLVLSRRVDEEIVFPNLNIRIKVVRSQGGRVSLGIDAPDFVDVVRAECLKAPENVPAPDARLRHQVRNFINHINLAFELYNRQTARGDVDGANATFLRLLTQLRSADQGRIKAEVENPSLSFGGPKVLVVDDDENERQLMAGLLEWDGCNVETAPDGRIAIDLLKNGCRPDVVLLDMHMPELCGKETLTAIRRDWSNLLVFGVSGSTPEENGIIVGDSNGVDEWFQKPLNPTQLVRQMHERLNRATVA